jgi:VanZ family protein
MLESACQSIKLGAGGDILGISCTEGVLLVNRRKWIIGIFVIALTVLYIWSNSLPSIEQSSKQSGKVLKLIETVFRTPPLDTEKNQYIIRKTAHMMEFSLLGLEMAVLLFITGVIRLRNIAIILVAGLAAAAMDETIQIFTHRGSQVSDVVLDFMGALLGIAIGFAVHSLFCRAKDHLQKRNQIIS